MLNAQQPPRRRTIAQDRAQLAWQAIQSVPPDQQGKYASRVGGLAAMIQINGLASSIAFLRAKNDADKILAGHLAIRVVGYLNDQPRQYTARDFMELIEGANTDTYRRATTEAIEYAIWLKRYVEAEGWKASN